MDKSIKKTRICNVGDIIFYGIFDEGFFCTENISNGYHIHSGFELFIVEKGEIMIENIDENRVCLSRGECAIIPPQNYHYTKPATKESEEVCRYVVRFRIAKNSDSEAVNLYDEFCKLIAGENIYKFKNPEIAKTAKSLKAEIAKNTMEAKLMSEVLFKKIMTEFIISIIDLRENYTEKNKKESREQRKEAIEAFLEKSYNLNDLNVKMLADYINLSVRQTNRLIKDYYGKTFLETVNDLRMSKAKKMLITSNMKTEEIAEKVGYQSLRGFVNAFRRKYGFSPNEFRRQNNFR